MWWPGWRGERYQMADIITRCPLHLLGLLPSVHTSLTARHIMQIIINNSLVLLNILLAASREVHPAPGGWPVSHPWTLHSGVVFTKWKSSITFLPELFTEPWYPIVQSFSFYLAKSDQILLRRLRFRFFSCWRLLTLGSTISSPPGETFQLKLISLSTR